ncbi:hypothetical protein P7K49_036792, partial [Saguinus oedipus]
RPNGLAMVKGLQPKRAEEKIGKLVSDSLLGHIFGLGPRSSHGGRPGVPQSNKTPDILKCFNPRLSSTSWPCLSRQPRMELRDTRDFGCEEKKSPSPCP